MKYKTPEGNYYELFKDMSKQPHLLIAGATGSGKSVVVNGILTTLLYNLPTESQFILIDPKMVELSKYKSLPHTLRYANKPDEMTEALQYALDITLKRFSAMEKQGIRYYIGSDIYVIIDEWADLMNTNGKVVTPILQRLCQIGRAARVHCIVCTQCPLREVIPTKIKVNLDARLGLRTRSAQDSRNIIGKNGLETLPAYGQGIYYTPAGDELYKIPYVSDSEQDRLVKWWISQKKRWWKFW